MQPFLQSNVWENDIIKNYFLDLTSSETSTNLCRLSCEGCRLMFIGIERRSASFTMFLKSFEAYRYKILIQLYSMDKIK